jgi:midasin (ATPase involved in ribosome maturation)
VHVQLLCINILVGDTHSSTHPPTGAVFPRTFSAASNTTFLQRIRSSFDNRDWRVLCRLMQQAATNALNTLQVGADVSPREAVQAPRKAQKTHMEGKSQELGSKWVMLQDELRKFERQIKHSSTSFSFWFAEGSLVKAWREGHWILLDEVRVCVCIYVSA